METTGDQGEPVVGVTNTMRGSGNGVVGLGVPIMGLDLAVNPDTTTLTFDKEATALESGSPPSPVRSVIFDPLPATISRRRMRNLLPGSIAGARLGNCVMTLTERVHRLERENGRWCKLMTKQRRSL